MKTFILGLCFFASSAVFAQTKASGNTAQASAVKQTDAISFDKDVYDFGKIPQGKPVSTFFEVKNVSNGIVKISDVHAGCGCTTPEWEKGKDLSPNGTTSIKVGYNAATIGNFTKNVTITYNDGLKKEIFIKGDVYATPSESIPTNEALKNMQ